MNEWHDVTLADISDQRKGINYKSEYYCDEDSGHPFITIKCFVKGGGYQSRGIKYFDGPFAPQDRLKAGDVLISVTDLTRAGDIVGSPLQVPDFGSERSALASMDCMKIAPKDGKCDSEFLYFRMMLPDIRRQMVAYSAGSTVLHLDTKKVPSMKIRIPEDIDHQKKLAGVLKLLTEAIEQTEALIEKYSLVKAGMMHDLFTRGLTPDGKLRPPRDEAPDLYKETPIGWIPKDWDVAQLASRGLPGTPHLKTGPFGSSLKGEHWVTDGHPVITIGALGEGEFIASELLFISDFDATRLSYFKLKEGEVVFSRVADVGRSVVIEEDQVGWVMSSNLMRIALDKNKALPHFLQFQLATDSRLKRQIRQKVNAGGRDVANSDILNRLQFVWPDPHEQKEIVKRAMALEDSTKAERLKLKKLNDQKSGLMHDLLTGEVYVNVDEPEAVNV